MPALRAVFAYAMHNYPCPTVGDCGAVYAALFFCSFSSSFVSFLVFFLPFSFSPHLLILFSSLSYPFSFSFPFFFFFLFLCLCIIFPLFLFIRVLRDSIPRFVGRSVGPSVRRSVCRSVTLYFFWVFAVYGLTASAQMIK